MITKETFDTYCSHKRIVVVGNAHSVLQRQDGPLIDSHDIVVRFNAGWPRPGFETHLGRRTDIWSCAIGSLPIKREGHRQMADRTYTVWSWHHTKKLLPELKPTTYHFGAPFFFQLKQQMGAIPTNGALMLAYLIGQVAYQSLTVVGFDFFRTHEFMHPSETFKGRHGQGHHNMDREETFMTQLLTQARDVEWIRVGF